MTSVEWNISTIVPIGESSRLTVTIQETAYILNLKD